ncbi:MAG: AlpA family transcriptional regulator [Alphaproteobacteria bacterium]
MEARMLRVPEVMARTGLSRTTLWRRVRAGTFPAPIQLGENSIGWPASEITAWLASRPRRTYGAETAPEAGAVA